MRDSLQLANVNNDDITTSFTFDGVVSGKYSATEWTLSAPVGYNSTVANTIDNPNLVTPKKTPLASLTVRDSIVSGTLTVPGWGVVVVVSDSERIPRGRLGL